MASACSGGRSPQMNLQWQVYILQCSDGTYYVGKTSDIEQRLLRHEKGLVAYTKERLPVKLIVLISFPDEWKAIKMEKYLKSGSGRAFAAKHFR